MQKALVVISVFGLIVIGMLLFTNHFGFALRIANYLYLLLFITASLILFRYEK